MCRRSVCVGWEAGGVGGGGRLVALDIFSVCGFGGAGERGADLSPYGELQIPSL